MRARTVNENTNFERGRSPKKVMGIGRLFNIDFFYADHPSIEGADVAAFIDDLESAIYDINPEVEFEIKMSDFSDGYVNFSGSAIDGEDMLDMLNARREAAMGSFESSLASWDFGDVQQGIDDGGELYDPDNYEDEYCELCGEEITGDNELTGEGGCEFCSGDISDR